MNEQELNQKFHIFEQQIMQLQEQLQVIEQTLFDMQTISLGLNELEGKVNENIFAPIGRGIYVEAKLMSEELLVDIGDKNYVKKTIPETKNLIENQKIKLNEMKKEVESELEKINEEITNTMKDYEENHVCSDENCKHKH